MNIRRNFACVIATIGIALTTVGCSVPAQPVSLERIEIEQVAKEQPQITAPNDVSIVFSRSEVRTVPAPVVTPPPAPPVRKVAEVPVGDSPVTKTPVVAAPPVQKTPVPAPVVVTPPVEPFPALDREVYVGLAGGQNVVDLGRGPVLFPLTGGVFPPYVAEHDWHGGWQRFGTLRGGMKVRMSGLVTGTYTVGQIINVPKGGNTHEFRQFKVMPTVMLQTCVPGTSRMIVVGLY